MPLPPAHLPVPTLQALYGERWEEQEKELGRQEGLSDLAKLLAVTFLHRWGRVGERSGGAG